MRHQSSSLDSTLSVLAVLLVCGALVSTAWAGTETVLVNFDGANGNQPLAGMIFDKAGNLYGTTLYGGAYASGIVFELSPNGDGTWTETILHSFGSGDDGNGPFASLVFDKAGNLYGTTSGGGYVGGVCSNGGCGTVFRLTPSSNGWTESVVYRFHPHGTGIGPAARLVLDDAGNMYSTTSHGGGCGGCGTVFELMPSHDWKEKVLHVFTGKKGDGVSPVAGVVLDASGNLYGLATGGTGCQFGCGVAFQLKRSVRGWKENILHNFGSYGGDAGYPSGDLALDQADNVYGSGAGGRYNNGAVFELSQSRRGWTEKVIYSFNGQDGGEPLNDGVILDTVGNLYGTTFSGGSNNNGVVFKLTHSRKGWSEQVLYPFSSGGLDGSNPEAGVVRDSAGNVYGTTSGGGSGTLGVVFEVTP